MCANKIMCSHTLGLLQSIELMYIINALKARSWSLLLHWILPEYGCYHGMPLNCRPLPGIRPASQLS